MPHDDVAGGRFFLGTKRKANIDNFNKLSLDALTGIVCHDDSQVAELTIKRAYDKVRPRIEVMAGALTAAA